LIVVHPNSDEFRYGGLDLYAGYCIPGPACGRFVEERTPPDSASVTAGRYLKSA